MDFGPVTKSYIKHKGNGKTQKAYYGPFSNVLGAGAPGF